MKHQESLRRFSNGVLTYKKVKISYEEKRWGFTTI